MFDVKLLNIKYSNLAPCLDSLNPFQFQYFSSICIIEIDFSSICWNFGGFYEEVNNLRIVIFVTEFLCRYPWTKWYVTFANRVSSILNVAAPLNWYGHVINIYFKVLYIFNLCWWILNSINSLMQINFDSLIYSNYNWE